MKLVISLVLFLIGSAAFAYTFVLQSNYNNSLLSLSETGAGDNVTLYLTVDNVRFSYNEGALEIQNEISQLDFEVRQELLKPHFIGITSDTINSVLVPRDTCKIVELTFIEGGNHFNCFSKNPSDQIEEIFN